MMKNLIKTLVTSLIILSLFSACDKYHIDRYVGDWEFVTEKSTIIRNNMHEIIEETEDTIYHSGAIHLVSENVLDVQFTKNETIRLILDPDKSLWVAFPTSYGTCHRCPAGHFEKNDKISLEFHLTTSTNDHGYLTHYAYLYYVQGFKQKGGK
jgi:hypothetical protein